MPNLNRSELSDLKDQINTFHQKGIEAAKWGIVYFINAGEGLRAVREGLPGRTFKPWLDENFEGGKTTAYKYMKLAEEKGKIHDLSVHRGERIESMRKAFAVLGAYYEPESVDAITAIQTPESPNTDNGSSMQLSEPPSLANEGGGSPVPTASEQAILDRLLKPGQCADFESGLDAPDEYQCYLCNNWFFADQMKRLHGNRYCYSCRQQLPNAPAPDEATAPFYAFTLFDEVPPEPPVMAMTNGTAPDTTATTHPPPMAQKDPYDEMLALAEELFPMLSSMEAVRQHGIYGLLRRFIGLFREIHQVKT